MYAFLFLAIPAAAIWYVFSKKNRPAQTFILPALTGIFSATVYTIILKFIVTLNENVTDSYSDYISMITFRYGLIPVLIICTAFFLISKDTVEYKTDCFVPLALSFQEICTGYFVIGNQEKNSFFLLICLPALTASVYPGAAALLSKAAELFEKTTAGIAKTCLLVLSAMAMILMITVIQALWFFNRPDALYTILSAVLFAAGIFLTVFLKKNQESEEF